MADRRHSGARAMLQRLGVTRGELRRGNDVESTEFQQSPVRRYQGDASDAPLRLQAQAWVFLRESFLTVTSRQENAIKSVQKAVPLNIRTCSDLCVAVARRIVPVGLGL